MGALRSIILASILLGVFTNVNQLDAQVISNEAIKTVRFTYKPNLQGPLSGEALLGTNKAFDSLAAGPADVQTLTSSIFNLNINAGGQSFDGLFTATHGLSQGFSRITVGQGTLDANNRVVIDATIRAKATVTNNPNARGGAEARARLKMGASRATVMDLQLNGVKVEGAAKIAKMTRMARERGLFLDPLRFTAENLVTGELIDADVYRNLYLAENGASVGFNLDDRLELSISDDLSLGSLAEFDSETLVAFATDLTGSARLENGQLTLSGLLDPGPNPLTDFWDLSFSVGDPTYITSAILKDGILDFDTIDILPLFNDPNTSLGDEVEFSFSNDVFSGLTKVPEPGCVPVLLIGASCCVFWRRKTPEPVAKA